MEDRKSKDIFKDGLQLNLDEDIEKDMHEVNNQKHNESYDFLSNINKSTNESFEKESFTYQKSSRYKKWIIQSILLGVAIGIIYFIVNKQTELIDFTNMSYDNVATWTTNKKIILTMEEQYSNNIPMDHVISQNIPPGEKMKKESTVKVIVSKGLDPYEKMTIPEFDSTWSKTSIENWIEQNGIMNYTFINTENSDIPANYLIFYELVGATKDTFVRSSEMKFTISYVDSVNTVTVPNFMDRDRIDVDIWAKNNNMQYTYTYEESSLYAEDRVMNQSIKPGEDMSPEDVIEVMISVGETNETIIMENFLDRTLVDVDIWAKNNNIQYTYSDQNSTIYAQDKIMYQSIDELEEIKEGDKISFVISNGSGMEEILMESFLNRPLLDVDVWAKNNEINYTYNYEYSSIYDKDRILYQSITPGNEIINDIELSFTVSKGEEIVVPNFNDMTVSEAEVYEEEPIEVDIVEKYIKGTNAGAFISQSIPAGDIAQEGTKITIEYSLGDEITVPSFIHEFQQQIEDWVGEENNKGARIELTINKETDTGLEYGKIISQNIYNDNIDLGATIEITISSGLTVPSFVSMSKEEAQDYSDASDINVEVVEVYKERTYQGEFLSQSIESGTMVNEDTKVIVEYSLGDSINIPKFVNQSIIEFEEWINEQNDKGAALTLTINELYFTDIEYGIISAQNIYNQPNAKIDTHIEVVVSFGDFYRVINFTNYSVNKIENIASENDLTIIFETVKDSSNESGTVISQEPGTGELINKKDFIKIKVAE